MITVLCGGVGAAKFLKGLLMVSNPGDVTAIVNTGDDAIMHGLHVSPDLDTIIYTLSGEINPETGWGRHSETWQAMATLRQLEREPGDLAWFNLGDKDIGTHLYRTARLRQGATLSEVAAEIAKGYGVEITVLPMSDNRVSTMMRLATGLADGASEEISFQEYFVKLRHDVEIASVRFDGAETALAAPGVAEAIAEAEVLVLAPSNPVVSLGPPLAIKEIRSAVVERVANGKPTTAISPLIGGQALKGPADRLLVEMGQEASSAGIARWYEGLIDTLVIDEADAGDKALVEACDIACVVTQTVMDNPEIAGSLAQTILDLTNR